MQSIKAITTQEQLEKAIQEDLSDVNYFLDCDCSLENE